MKPRLVKRGVWILARESIFLIALPVYNQYIYTAVVHESDNNLTRPQNSRLCNTYMYPHQFNYFLFDCQPCLYGLEYSPLSSTRESHLLGLKNDLNFHLEIGLFSFLSRRQSSAFISTTVDNASTFVNLISTK